MGYARNEQVEYLRPDAFQAVFEAAPAALALIEPGVPVPSLIAANEAFLQAMMVPRPAVEGRRIDAVFRAAAAVQVREAVEQCLLDGEPVRLRVAHAPAAKVMRLEIELRRIVIERAPFVVLNLSPLDRPLSLAELGEAGVLAELGALSRGLVYIQDVQRRRVRYGHHPLVTRLGLPPGPVSLDHIEPLVHHQDFDRFMAFLDDQAAAPDDRVAKTTFRMCSADGQWLWINVRSRVLTRTRDGGVHRVIGVATDVTQAHIHTAAMAAAAEALDHAELNERRRIGRELHDATSQLLVAARLGLNDIEAPAGLTPVGRQALRRVRQSIAGAQAEIRNFSYMLHPPSLQAEGLAHSLRTFAAGFSHRTGIAISVRIGRGLGRLPPRLELALYRIAQEALMNVYRHAKAKHAWLSLRRSEGQAVLEIEDDGVGLAPAPVAGVGISGMQARMTQLGGSFVLEPGRTGLLVRATAPVAPPT